MSLDVFQACVKGYGDRLFDKQLLGVQAGYWAGYYQRTKKPSPPHSIITKLLSKKVTKKSKHADTVDVEGFLLREAQFKTRLEDARKAGKM